MTRKISKPSKSKPILIEPLGKANPRLHRSTLYAAQYFLRHHVHRWRGTGPYPIWSLPAALSGESSRSTISRNEIG